MAVLHDYACLAHGDLGEMFEPVCPHGCSKKFIRIVFKKAPGIRSNGTKVADASLRALANDFGLTNIGSNGGESVMDYLRRGKMFPDGYHPQDEREMGFAPRFMDVPHAAPGWSQAPDAKAPSINPGTMINSKVAGENAPARLFGLQDEGRLPQSDGHVAIPKPVPQIDPKLVYRPTEMPEAPE